MEELHNVVDWVFGLTEAESAARKVSLDSSAAVSYTPCSVEPFANE